MKPWLTTASGHRGGSKYVNKVMIGLNKLGIGGDKGPVVLTVPGPQVRETTLDAGHPDDHRRPPLHRGRPARAVIGRRTPGPPGEATVHQGRSDQRVRVVEIPAEQARPLLRQFPVLVPTGVGFMRNAGLVTGPNPDEFEALAGRCPVFRLDPV